MEEGQRGKETPNITKRWGMAEFSTHGLWNMHDKFKTEAVYATGMTMSILSRRYLTFLLPSLAASLAAAQQKQLPLLPSKVYTNDQIPYHGDQTKKGREFFNGVTHSGFNIEVHETALGPGIETHAPHKHEHEEIIIVVEGTLETNVEGQKEKADGGSVVYFGSNQMHNARNVGTTPCRYYVIELRGTASHSRQQA